MANELKKIQSSNYTLVQGKTVAHWNPPVTATITSYFGQVLGAPTFTLVQIPPQADGTQIDGATISIYSNSPFETGTSTATISNGVTYYQQQVVVKDAYTTTTTTTTPGYYTYDIQPDYYTISYGPNIGWNSAAVSIPAISGDGLAEFTMRIDTAGAVVGLNLVETSGGDGYIEIPYGFFISKGFYRVIENGVAKTNNAILPYANTTFSISRSSGTIKYYVGGALVYTSLTFSYGDLLLDTSLYTAGDSVVNASLTSATTIPAYDYGFSTLAGVSGIDATPKAEAFIFSTSAMGLVGGYYIDNDFYTLSNALTSTSDITVSLDFGFADISGVSTITGVGSGVTEIHATFGVMSAFATSGYASYAEINASLAPMTVAAETNGLVIPIAFLSASLSSMELSAHCLTGENTTASTQTLNSLSVMASDHPYAAIQASLKPMTAELGAFIQMDDYSGCASISCNNYWGSGTLLWNGRAILTAAHVVDGITPDQYPSVNIFFKSTLAIAKPRVAKIIIHPGYVKQKDSLAGVPEKDLAIIILKDAVDAKIMRYSLYTTADEVPNTFTRYGYSAYVNPQTEEVDPNLWQWHYVTNKYEVYQRTLTNNTFAYSLAAGDRICYDYDNGLVAQDIIGGALGIVNLGIPSEGGARHGDSGSAAFINGKIAGVSSFIKIDTTYDIAPKGYGGSYGEMDVDVRVASYQSWITSTVGVYVQLFPHILNAPFPSFTIHGNGHVEAPVVFDLALFDTTLAARGGAVLGKDDIAPLFDLGFSAHGTLRESGHGGFPLFETSLTASGTVFGNGSASLGLFTSTLTGKGGAKAALESPTFGFSAAGTNLPTGHAELSLFSLSLSGHGTLQANGSGAFAFVNFVSAWASGALPAPVFGLSATGSTTVNNAVAYVMNIHTTESTAYSAYNFKHIIAIGGKFYGVKSDGLYLLEGDTDSGTPVNGMIVTKETDLGDFRSKNIPVVYLNSDTTTTVTPYTDTVIQPSAQTTFGGRKAKLARGSKGRYWKIKVEHIKKLEGLEILPEILDRRVK